MVRFAAASTTDSSQCSVAASSTSYTSSSGSGSGPGIHDDYIDFCDVDDDDDDRDDGHHKVDQVNRGISQTFHPTTGTSMYPKSRSSSSPTDNNPEDVALINALMELQHELRIKHEEVTVLQQTLSNLSRIVHESDRHVEHLEMLNERLQFKLQMLTFLEDPNDEALDLDDLDSHHHHHHHAWNPRRDQNRRSSTSSGSSSSHALSRHSLFPPQHPWDTYSTGSDDSVVGTLGTTTEMNHWTAEDPVSVEAPPPRPQLRRSASMSSLQPLLQQQQLPVSFPLLGSPSASSVVSKSPPRPETWNANRRTRTSTPVSVDDMVHNDDDDDDDDDDNEDSTTKSTTSKERTRSQNNSNHDLFQEEKKDDDLCELTTEDFSKSETNVTRSTRSNVLVGPSQAHFYQIIQERDAYKTKYQRIMNDYHATQKKLYSAQYKLRSCNALLELSYHNHSTGGSGQKMNRKVSKSHAPSEGPPKATATPRRPSAPQSPASVISPSTPHHNHHVNTAARNHPPPPLSSERAKIRTTWRRNSGIVPTTTKEKASSSFLSECVSYISHDEMIHPHWNASSDQAVEAMATDQYIDALVACEPTKTTTTTRGSKKESSTAMDTDDNRLYRHQPDDADRGAGRPTTVAPSPKRTSRVVESIMFDV